VRKWRQVVIGVTLAALLAASGLAEEGAPSARLSLSSGKHAYATVDNIEVVVSVVSERATYVVMYPHYFPVNMPSGVVPESWLTFSITDSKGLVLHKTAEPPINERLKEAVPCDFLRLAPGYFHGVTISLSRGAWAHSISAPGKYRVKARLVVGAQDWVLGRLARGRFRKDELPFDTEHLLGGSLESGEIEIEVR